MSNVARKSKSSLARWRGRIRVAPALAAAAARARVCPAASLAPNGPNSISRFPPPIAKRRSARPMRPCRRWIGGAASARKELTSLMEDAQIFNLDIAVAVAQIVQADAQVGVSGAPLLPSITGTATAEREHSGSQTGSSSGAVGYRERRLDLLAITIAASPRAT